MQESSLPAAQSTDESKQGEVCRVQISAFEEIRGSVVVSEIEKKMVMKERGG